MADDEVIQGRSGRSKRIVPKVMVLSAIARPKFDGDGNCTFDGKLEFGLLQRPYIYEEGLRIALKEHLSCILSK